MSILLCVGGSRDGHYLRICDSDQNITVWATSITRTIDVKDFPVVQDYLSGGPLPKEIGYITHETYERQHFRGNDRSFYVLVPIGQTADETIEKLISGYRV